MRSKQQFLSVFFIIILLNRWFKKIYVYALVVLVAIGYYLSFWSFFRSDDNNAILLADSGPLVIHFLLIWLFSRNVKIC